MQIIFRGSKRKSMKNIDMKRSIQTSASFILLIHLMPLLSIQAQDSVVAYPASGNINPKEGTIEMWLRLDEEPGLPPRHSFPFFAIQAHGEKDPRFRLIYNPIWKPDVFHFYLSCMGIQNGKLVRGPYLATMEEGAEGIVRTIEIPRLHPGEWRYLVTTWKTDKETEESTVELYFDSQVAIQTELRFDLWGKFDPAQASVSLQGYAGYTIDSFRVSSKVRSWEEISKVFTRGDLEADPHTLLLDRFENVSDKVSIPEINQGKMAQKDKTDEKSFGVLSRDWTQQVEGKKGKALKIWRPGKR